MARKQTGRARQIFKESCTHCARAKVKCSKGKPECARCGERGLPCSYGLSNRYGRLPAHVKLSDGGHSHDDSYDTWPTQSAPRHLLAQGPSPISTGPITGDIQPRALVNPHNSQLFLDTDSSATSDFLGYGSDFAAARRPLGSTSQDPMYSGWVFQDQQGGAVTRNKTLNPESPVATWGYHPSPVPARLEKQPIHHGHKRTPSVASTITSTELEFAPDYAESHRHPAYPLPTPPSTAFTGSEASSPPPAADGEAHSCIPQASAILVVLKSGQRCEVTHKVLRILDCDCFARDDHLKLITVLIGFELMARCSKAIRARTDGAYGGSTDAAVMADLRTVLAVIEPLLKRLKEASTRARKRSRAAAAAAAAAADKSSEGEGSHISLAVFGPLEADLLRQLRELSGQTTTLLRWGRARG
ncbi:hypothetical protein F4778DRAFT_744616 [Xylariomycetidae sp. FL2044]|nr:hypothetical protein F4778DRAFT_744616 [Xylariomycetidae sp. FL2044]